MVPCLPCRRRLRTSLAPPVSSPPPPRAAPRRPAPPPPEARSPFLAHQRQWRPRRTSFGARRASRASRPRSATTSASARTSPPAPSRAPRPSPSPCPRPPASSSSTPPSSTSIAPPSASRRALVAPHLLSIESLLILLTFFLAGFGADRCGAVRGG